MHRSEPLDTVFMVHTPEHSEFRFYLAGIFERMLACAIDHVIILITFWLLIMVVGFFGLLAGEGLGAFVLYGGVLLGVFIAWTYFIVFEGLWGGRTPGKALLKLRVVSGEGTPIHMKQAVVRNLLRVVDMIPSVGGIGSFSVMPFYALGFTSAFFSRRNQRLGDLAANTVVVKDGNARRRTMPSGLTCDATRMERLPKGLSLSRQQNRALVAYIMRRENFGDLRREELAQPLAEHLRKRYSIEDVPSHDELLCLVYARLFGPNR